MSPTPEGTNDSSDADGLVEMCVSMDELCHHNHMLEEDVNNIR